MFWITLTLSGLALTIWAMRSLPKGTDMMPVPPKVRVKDGPYRWLKHPMYVGNTLFVAGLAGLAAGFWNALAIGSVCEMLMRYWAGLEES